MKRIPGIPGGAVGGVDEFHYYMFSEHLVEAIAKELGLPVDMAAGDPESGYSYKSGKLEYAQFRAAMWN